MDTKFIVISMTIVAVLVVLTILLFVLFKFKSANKELLKKIESAKNATSDLISLLNIVSDQNSSRNELDGAIRIFIKEFKIPTKTDGKIPKEAKNYLQFALLLASHKRADAKLIAFMSNEIKKKNPEYADEIEFYEEQGRIRRKSQNSPV